MATTTGSTRPIVSVGGVGGTLAAPSETYYAEDTAIAVGDVLIFAAGGGYVDEDNTPAVSAVVGVCTGLFGGLSAQGDPVMVSLALPGHMFEGSLINTTGPADVVGVQATHIGQNIGISEDSDGYAQPAINAATDTIWTHWWGRQVYGDEGVTQDSDRLTAGVGATNPRVIFSFESSVWHG